MNYIWKMPYGTAVTAVFKMTVKSICHHIWASSDLSGDEFLDVGNQPVPLSPGNGEFSLSSLEKVSSFHPVPRLMQLPLGFLPVFNNRSWFSLHPSDLGSVWHSPVQEQNLFTVWDVLTPAGSSFPQGDLWALEMSLLLYIAKSLTHDSHIRPRAYESCCLMGGFVFLRPFLCLFRLHC